MSVLIQFAIGLIFGAGLLISGMSNPAKVLNFLDLAAIRAGSWDPSLMFVMLGAVATAFIGFRMVLKRQRPLLGDTFHLPASNDIDPRIIIGPAIFGVGWGLAGFCPGPAFVALGYGTLASVLFVIAMMIGMAAARALAERQPTLATPSYE
ncbi:YeeE/YedE family protein [Bradyrhizobium iriomotense]|uniref:Membrane protein n=1 Tax=Bradyrhizobium iriomotense TaxID=441950 RepID=A0ABQ6B754_9BRAD|nr:YeeE/YedE family protein [Bradyrhizobium iriomotense]GLR87872.1 membrane protein [Bradyrhizobium iriomotense]